MTVYVLVLFIGSGGISIGGYKDYDGCEKAGFMASKRETIEFLCIPAQMPMDKPLTKAVTAKGKKK